ncbi:MAG: adenosylmethionine decarboxylase [Candidatus Eisenbacteria bacterium]|nr:adenosylmethionine decarboxylase [Candidatus Eisenbacteria bacterium]
MHGLGPHLVLDGYGCPKEKLADLALVYRTLDEFPGRIGMTKIMPPYVFKYVGSNPDNWGVSGFVLIAESHISIHTWPEKLYLSIDIFSCKEFSSESAIAYMKEAFGIERVDSEVVERGLGFPRELHAARGTVEKERKEIEKAEQRR